MAFKVDELSGVRVASNLDSSLRLTDDVPLSCFDFVCHDLIRDVTVETNLFLCMIMSFVSRDASVAG